jgi:hypothetical protein
VSWVRRRRGPALRTFHCAGSNLHQRWLLRMQHLLGIPHLALSKRRPTLLSSEGVVRHGIHSDTQAPVPVRFRARHAQAAPGMICLGKLVFLGRRYGAENEAEICVRFFCSPVQAFANWRNLAIPILVSSLLSETQSGRRIARSSKVESGALTSPSPLKRTGV